MVAVASCATVEQAPPPTAIQTIAAPTPNEMVPEKPRLKRKIAVARFSNSTNYGKGLLFDGENDPLADQATDMLVKRLIESDAFIVFERDNLDALAFEQSLNNPAGEFDLVGVDAVVIGSVTEFGRSTEGQVGFLSSTKKQTASAVVEARLVDPNTGLAFFSASGSGQTSVEAGEVAGFGSRAAYDSSLNDAAISAAISDMLGEFLSKLSDRRWSTDVLRIDGDRLYISGGGLQGLKIGDQLRIETVGESVKSGQSGLSITLPGEYLALAEVQSFFGEDEYSEGSILHVLEGSMSGYAPEQLVVVEG